MPAASLSLTRPPLSACLFACLSVCPSISLSLCLSLSLFLSLSPGPPLCPHCVRCARRRPVRWMRNGSCRSSRTKTRCAPQSPQAALDVSGFWLFETDRQRHRARERNRETRRQSGQERRAVSLLSTRPAQTAQSPFAASLFVRSGCVQAREAWAGAISISRRRRLAGRATG